MSVSASEIRDLLRLIRGVEAVDVKVAADGSIDSVEVRIADSRSTARVIRDIESALMSGLPHAVPYRPPSRRRHRRCPSGEPSRPRL